MAKWVADEVLDGALQVISGATRMVAVAGQPANYAAAWAGRLAEATMSGADFALANGDASGRKVSVAAKTGVPVVAAGTADHVALVSPVGERLIYVTTCPARALAAGGSVNFDAWAVELGDPV